MNIKNGDQRVGSGEKLAPEIALVDIRVIKSGIFLAEASKQRQNFFVGMKLFPLSEIEGCQESVGNGVLCSVSSRD